jgi:SAM-dependent methyltransferase
MAAEDRDFWFRARNRTIAALAERPIQRLGDEFRILEVGCGSGNVLRVLRDLAAGRGTVEGLELSHEGRRRGNEPDWRSPMKALEATLTEDVIPER